MINLRKFTTLLSIAVSACIGLSNCKKPPEGDAGTPPVKPEPSQQVAILEDIDAEAAGKLVAAPQPPTVIDVRTPGEFAAGHIEGALNIDFNGSSFRDELEKLDRDQTYLLHCQVGGRSGSSKSVFSELGFKTVYHLDGGFLAWEKAGLPTVK